MKLYLTLKKKWFDMIDSGIKKEEYREIKPYWIARLFAYGNAYDPPRDFISVVFKNGYGKNSPVIEFECLDIISGYGKPEWGAEAGKEYFIIKLGNKINSLNPDKR